MGTLTLSEAEAEVRYHIGGDDETAETRVRLWLKWGYDLINRPNVYRHPELETSEDLTLGASRILPLVTVFQQIEYVEHYLEQTASVVETTVKRTVWPTRGRELARRGQYPSGPPSYYDFRGNQLYLDKVPDAAATQGQLLRVWGINQAAVVDVDDAAWTTELRREWDPIWVLGGTYFAWVGKGRYDLAQEVRDELARLVNDQTPIYDLSARDEGEPMLVEGTVTMRS